MDSTASEENGNRLSEGQPEKGSGKWSVLIFRILVTLASRQVLGDENACVCVPEHTAGSDLHNVHDGLLAFRGFAAIRVICCRGGIFIFAP